MSPEPFDSRAKAPPAKRWEKGYGDENGFHTLFISERKSVTPNFDTFNSLSDCSKTFKKIFQLEKFCANVLKLKGARSRYFRQFQHWSNGHRINENIKITVQDYRRTQTKHRKAKKEHGWTKLERIEMNCLWVNLKNVGPPFFKFMTVYIKMSFTQR